jgi:hypothetical protein
MVTPCENAKLHIKISDSVISSFFILVNQVQLTHITF